MQDIKCMLSCVCVLVLVVVAILPSCGAFAYSLRVCVVFACLSSSCGLVTNIVVKLL